VMFRKYLNDGSPSYGVLAVCHHLLIVAPEAGRAGDPPSADKDDEEVRPPAHRDTARK